MRLPSLLLLALHAQFEVSEEQLPTPAPEVNVSLTGLGKSADTDLTLTGKKALQLAQLSPNMPSAALKTN